MKKLIYFALALTVLMLSCACTKREQNVPENSDRTEEETTDPSALELARNGICGYRIVRPDGGDTDTAEVAGALRLAFRDTLGVTPEIVTDFEAETEKEILVGRTNRSASGAAAERLRDSVGYLITVTGEQIVICATDVAFLREAVNAFVAEWLEPCRGKQVCTVPRSMNRQISKQDYIRNGWSLQTVPAYEGGTLSDSLYACGAGFGDDSGHDTKDESQMQLISGTSTAEFRSYLKKLERNGFSKVFENKVDDSEYAEYRLGEVLVYTWYHPKKREARVILDRSGIALDELKTGTEAGGAVEFYQFRLNYCEGSKDSSPYPDCGMFYIFRLRDNSLFLIDGGHPKQATDADLDRVMAFLRNITGSETVQVRAWFITHAHGDHAGLPDLLLRKYASDIRIDTVMANIPCMNQIGGYSDVYRTFLGTLEAKYPSAAFLKLHPGMTFSMGGLTVDVLYTHEEAVNAETGKTKISDFNDSSTVLRVTFGGKRVLFLGDANKVIEESLIELYAPETLQADIVQIAHHGINPLNYIYRMTKGTYALVSNSEVNAHLNGGSCERAYAIYSRYFQTILYEMDATYRFRIADGELVQDSVK